MITSFHATCVQTCIRHPRRADHSRQQPPCSLVHTQQTPRRQTEANTGCCERLVRGAVVAAACRAYWRACAMRQWSSYDKTSRSASVTSWLTERSMKKAVYEASLQMPLICFAARINAAVMLAPRLASRHSSIPLDMRGAIRVRRTSNFVAALRCWQRRTGSHRCSAAQR